MKLSREELEAEVKRYKDTVEMLYNTVLGGMGRTSLEDMHLISATEGYYRMTGYTREESLQPPFSNCGLNLVVPEDIPTQERERRRQNLLNEERFRIISEQTKDIVFEWEMASDCLHYSPVYGDEFAAFLTGFGDAASLGRRLEQFRQEISCDFTFEEKIYPLTISIGVALYPEDGTTFQELYENADVALYRAKRHGGNRLEFFA